LRCFTHYRRIRHYLSIQGISEERSASLPVFVAEIELQIDDVDAILSFVRTLETPGQ